MGCTSERGRRDNWPLTAHLIVLVALAMLPANSDAAIITTLFNTGVGDDGNGAPDESVDPHYQLIVNPDGTGAQSYVVQQGVFPLYPIHYWFADDSTSKWIGAQPTYGSLQGDVPNADYTFQTTFSLAGYDPSTAQIDVAWSTDNNGVDVLINGISLGQTTSPISSYLGFSTFTIDHGFVSGVNTLDFIVHNGPDGNPPPFTGNPVGLRVELSGTATAVPEPTTLSLFGFGLIGLAGWRWHGHRSRTKTH